MGHYRWIGETIVVGFRVAFYFVSARYPPHPLSGISERHAWLYFSFASLLGASLFALFLVIIDHLVLLPLLVVLVHPVHEGGSCIFEADHVCGCVVSPDAIFRLRFFFLNPDQKSQSCEKS